MAEDMHDRVTAVIASKLRIEKDLAAEVTSAVFKEMEDPTAAMCAAVSMNINADSVWRQMVRTMRMRPMGFVALQGQTGFAQSNLGAMQGRSY